MLLPNVSIAAEKGYVIYKTVYSYMFYQQTFSYILNS